MDEYTRRGRVATDGGTTRDPFESLPDPALVYRGDEAAVVARVNDAFRAAFDRDPAGEPLAAALPGTEPPSPDDLMAGGPFDVAVSTDDDPSHYRVAATTDDGGGVVTYVDVTARERDLETVRAQRDRLDEFASLLAHDLRNPLEVAMARTELARDLGGDEHFLKVENALERMEGIIGQLLELAEEGAVVGDREQVGVDAVAREAWDTVETGDASLAFAGPPVARADPGRLRELFENLFRNALVHGGADVTVTVGGLADGAGFYVADDGPGIAPDDRGDVFKAGFTTAENGTGFGLTIVHRIAAGHGWDVTATASEDGGARFEFTGLEPLEMD
jgi:signal transduction histidine kinase